MGLFSDFGFCFYFGRFQRYSLPMGWCVALSRPNSEHRAQLHLERQGFVTYVPRFNERVAIGGKKVLRPRPLFPRYLFIQQLLGRWRSITGTIGVAQLLCVDDKPMTMPDAEIEKLKAREHNGFVVLDAEPKFKPGQSVRIANGELAGMLGLYSGMSARDREIVLLNILGRMCKTELAVGSVLESAA